MRATPASALRSLTARHADIARASTARIRLHHLSWSRHGRPGLEGCSARGYNPASITVFRSFGRSHGAMPTYTYQCDSCGHGFEAVQRFADDPLSECPQCRASIRRVIQPVGVVFKGSGWYITDSRPKSSGEGG